jgi:transposase
MTTNAIARLVREHDTKLWRVLEHYVDCAHDQLDLSDVTELGVDETSRAKGHDYVTLFVDMIKRRVAYVTEGKDHETVARFRVDLEQHGGSASNVREFSMDMSQAFIKGVQAQFPNASLTFDRYHVMELANDAVDEVRRQEQKTAPELTGTRMIWLKNKSNLDAMQLASFEQLRNSTLSTARAWRIKDTLRLLYDQPSEQAEQYLKKWYFWATHSRIAPIVKLAKTIKAHWDGVLRWFESGLSQGLVEGINSLIQAAKARARGFRSVRKMVVTIYLVAGKLDSELAKLLPYVTHTG